MNKQKKELTIAKDSVIKSYENTHSADQKY